MSQYNKTRSNVGQNVTDLQFAEQASPGTDGSSEDPKPVASDFTSIGNGTPLVIDGIIDGGLNGGVDEGSTESLTSRGVVAGNAGGGLVFSDGIVSDFGALVPSGLISDGVDEPLYLGARNRSASNASGNLVFADSGIDPFAAPLAGLT